MPGFLNDFAGYLDYADDWSQCPRARNNPEEHK